MEKKLSGKALAVIAHADDYVTPVTTAPDEAEWRSLGLLTMGAARKDKKLALSLLAQWKNKLCNKAEKALISPMDGVYLGEAVHAMRYKPDYKPFLAELFPVLLHNFGRLFQYHNPFEDGMITLQQAGAATEPYLMSNALQAGQAVQCPGYQTAVLWSSEYLIALGYKMKADVEDLILNNELAVFSVNEKLWLKEEEQYGVFLMDKQIIVDIGQLAAFCPLACGAPTQEQAEILLSHLESDPWRSAPHGLPTAGFSEPDVVDLFLNWLMVKGLLRYEMYSAAARLRTNILLNISHQGIFEQYDAHSGAGIKNANSPYAAALVLDLLHSI